MNYTIKTSLLCLTALPTYNIAIADNPNIVLIISDDQGYADFSRYNQQQVQTPNLDKLCDESRYFNNFYVAPASAPTRAALLTGKSFVKSGVWNVHFGGDYIGREHTLLSEVVQQAGYNTALIGKWHSGKGPGFIPQHRGYDYVKPILMHTHYNNRQQFNDAPLYYKDHEYWKENKQKDWSVNTMTTLACDYINQEHNQPYFLQVAYVAPHSPWDAPKELVDKYIHMGQREEFAKLNALIEHMDNSVGKIIDCIDNSKDKDNTIIIFISDNGYIHKSTGVELTAEEIALRNPMNLRGVKGSIYEGGIYSPLYVRWKGKIIPGETDWLTHVTDILPTIAQLAGVTDNDIPDGLNGESFKKVLFDGDAQQPYRVICDTRPEIPMKSGYKPNMLKSEGDRDMDRKLVDFNTGSIYARDSHYKLIQDKGKLALYDMTTDRSEQRNIAESNPLIVNELKESMDAWCAEVLANKNSFKSPTYPIGIEPGGVLYFNGTAKLFGTMKGRGSRAPHSLTAKTPQSGVVWNIDVVKPGKFEVYLEADIDVEDVNVVVNTQTKRITKRLTKGEKIHNLGVIEITETDKHLKFKITDIEGSKDAAFWNISLKQID
ncbi:MAG: sulfatase-like hydrolase/transferase [Bacteroidales bacterium]